MKPLHRALIALLALACVATPAVSQTDYEATMDLIVAGSTLNVDIYLRYLTGVVDNLGDATLAFNFNGNVVSYVGKDAAFDGPWDDGASPTNYQDLFSSRAGSGANSRAALNVLKVNTGGAGGVAIPGTRTRVGRIQFTILNPALSAAITWRSTATSVFNYGGTSLKSRFAFVNPDDVPLPITLASFTAQTVTNGVQLHWTTLTEVNNYGFEVQKAQTQPGDYQTIPNGFIPGHGTTLEPRSYAYVDVTATPGIWYYRLKQIDLDGTVQYSEGIRTQVVTAVKEVAPLVFALHQNYPNPFNPTSEIKFSVESTGKAVLKVYNTLGAEVATLFDGMAEAGQYYQVQFAGSGMASGIYFYRLQSGTKSELKKMLLLK